MEDDRSRIREELLKRFSELSGTPPPKGLASACGEIDIDIYEYDGYIAGLVDSYLSGADIGPASINRAEDLYHRLSECEAKLRDLRRHLDLASEVASLLIECLSTVP